MDLKAVKTRVGNPVCLMGNLDPVELLWRATPELVSQAARTAIQDAAEGSGFILGSGCEVPIDAPIENLKAMIAVARNATAAVP